MDGWKGICLSILKNLCPKWNIFMYQHLQCYQDIFCPYLEFALWLNQCSPDIAMDWSDHAIWWPTRNIWLDKTRWAFNKQTMIKEKYKKNEQESIELYQGGRWTSTVWTQTQWSISRQCTRPSGKTSIPMIIMIMMTMMMMITMMTTIGCLYSGIVVGHAS